MSNLQNNPNSGQKTILQPSGWRTKFKVAKHRTKTLMIGMALLGGVLKTMEVFVNISQFPQAICSLTPLCPPRLDDPVWIGTKIEDVYIKKLNNYEIETTLVVTDKAPSAKQEEDISVLRNVDQKLSKAHQHDKKNSGQFEAILRKAKNDRKPLCLKIYGRRNFATSEFKNIIVIDDDFPKSQKYDSLTSKERDDQCIKKPRPIDPNSGN
jgi:hypothetical protein